MRIIVAMCSHANVNGYLSHKYFDEIMKIVQADKSNMALDEELATSNQLSGFMSVQIL